MVYAATTAPDGVTPGQARFGSDTRNDGQRRADKEEVERNSQDGMNHVAHPF
jgi:hypothetical protein